MPKINLKLIHKIHILPNVVSLIFTTSDDYKFLPGQFFTFAVGENQYRSYSCFYNSNVAPDFYKTDLVDLPTGHNYLGFMVNTKPGGSGSRFFESIQTGGSYNANGANGQFSLQESNRPKVFVASSTGIAPFIPMIDQLYKSKPDQEILLFFGAWKKSDNFAIDFVKQFPQVRVIGCYDEIPVEQIDQNNQLGRVTNIIPKLLSSKIQDYDFYVCGNQMLVEATVEMLKEKDVTTIYKESYSSPKIKV